jgi:hypothetical protein
MRQLVGGVGLTWVVDTAGRVRLPVMREVVAETVGKRVAEQRRWRVCALELDGKFPKA